ncbi:MAG: WD40 repeat domain-containing protein [Roseofilum sp. SBFL]|nr:WD40 repeat domain-containing protein [Roseofilum sp. SBFL]
MIIGNSAEFSSDSKYLATWYSTRREIYLRNLEDRRLTVLENSSQVVYVHFSPDSKLIAVIGTDYTVNLLDFSGNLIRTIKLQQLPINLAFSPDSQRIAILGDPDELSVWGAKGELLAKYTIPESGSEFKFVEFAPDGKSIAVGGRRVRIYPNQTLDELIATGCEWLEDYFTTYPEEKEKLPACQ